MEGMESKASGSSNAADREVRLENLAVDRSFVPSSQKFAMKGMESKDSGSSDAADREVRLFVMGYDTSLPKDDIRSLLTKHFSSFGKVFDALIATRMAMVYLRGGPSVEKVEELNGGCECDVEGGCKIVVNRVFPLNNSRKCPAMGLCHAIPDCYIQMAIKLNAKPSKRAKKDNNAMNVKNAKMAKKPKKAKNSK